MASLGISVIFPLLAILRAFNSSATRTSEKGLNIQFAIAQIIEKELLDSQHIDFLSGDLETGHIGKNKTHNIIAAKLSMVARTGVDV